MRILVTNDDGIDAAGILALARALVSLGEVMVAAPERERSASGHSITLHKPLHAFTRDLGPNVRAWAITGTPVDCVKLAVEALLRDPPDLVVSGINNGSNLGRDVFYSGTVSAAIEALFLGIPAIAISLASPDGPGFPWAAAFVKWWLQNGYEPPPAGVLYNLNLPRLVPRLPTEVRRVKLGKRQYQNEFHRRVDPRGHEYFWLAGSASDETEEPDTDVGAVARGYVTLTPLRLEITALDLVPIRPGHLPIDADAIRIPSS